MNRLCHKLVNATLIAFYAICGVFTLNIEIKEDLSNILNKLCRQIFKPIPVIEFLGADVYTLVSGYSPTPMMSFVSGYGSLVWLHLVPQEGEGV